MTTYINKTLFTGAVAVLIVAIVHFYLTIAGGDLYVFFGAGEEFAALDKAGSLKPMITTFIIAIVFTILALFGFSGAGLIGKMPLLKWGLYTIAIIFIARGLLFFYEVYVLSFLFSEYPVRFVLFSLYSLITGTLYLFGTIKYYKNQ